ncbi:hypothetical protein F5Y09DRAFT_307456 [Xylaria sp. FL1042]|nr:hypothetical protein F5Y09DRAFT_307456 [Xylaria sp. FL1042]
MNTPDQIMYASCWVVLMLYIASTVTVFARRSCIGCAVSFLFACLLWLDLSLFNAWFFLPAFVCHVQEIDLHVNNTVDLFQVIFTSEAARDIYLMMLGSFGSSLAVFNAANMLQNEGRIAMYRHEPGRFSRYFIKSVYRVCDYLDIGNDNLVILPTTKPTYIYQNEHGVWEITSLS